MFVYLDENKIEALSESANVVFWTFVDNEYIYI